VLFVTKKKAISSILDDFKKIGYDYNITVINYESLHKLKSFDFDLVIYDEAHTLGTYQKPSVRTKLIKSKLSKIPCIFLSGTPAAESYSQFYHQFYVSDYSPFKESNFYKWAKKYVDVKKKRIGTHEVNDYSDANEILIESIINDRVVTMTQVDAGIHTKINEHYLYVNTPKPLQTIVRRLKKDRAIEGKNGFIMAETPAKLQSKVHQIYNGSVILDDFEGNPLSFILSNYKAEFIKDKFKGKKIAIMYYYKAEFDILKDVFKNNITDDLEEFNKSHKLLAIQQSTTEGMNLSKADCLVYYNFGFSGKNYIQSRDRLTVKDRASNDVYFILETNGINEKILKAVSQKKDYNNAAFKKDFL
jgi:hypothetical protein